ncbi:NAD(P)-dependent oxidoreductase [Aliifodinibius salipaludis]|uniref:NAD(P)-dependent oxidoreductase n=1 Tax=Fodinibius salipaludis TaxID=2032627 RepID=A0A2A2G9F7_9BACT|nr:SDR family oxidoreductase [Aliifodinibius salipaludis]PAU93483.1 NAD(P)-dependent oxidoreductase [Aliifodinibius salipaludis]
MKENLHCLVTGVTGYIGGRLVPELLKKGYHVRVLSRDTDRLQGRPWINDVEVVEADVLEAETLPTALEHIDVAYYLIHSMSGKGSSEFHNRDVQAARNFGNIASQQNVDRIIYLGGLGDPDDQLSEHLASRQKTGSILRESGVSVTEFRAAVVVGSGSKSFEMVRYLTERVPIMICPSWVYSKVQPIAIRNVLQYLVSTIENPATEDEIIEIGGSSVITYADMMKIYAEVNGLKRILIPVPVLSPTLSSHWVHWMTPIPASLARPLIEGLKNDVVVQDDKTQNLFPEIKPLSYKRAVELAITRIDTDDVETTWNDALISSKGDEEPVILKTKEGLNIERRIRTVNASPQHVFETFASLGGQKGWPAFQWAWKLRGIMDRLVGGVGFRRGRRHPTELRVGDALDFWRVEAIKPGELLRLRAEMKVPGRAWLEFQAKKEDKTTTKLVQTAYFAPKGLFGLLYWYGLYPFHSLIFSRMIEKLAQQAENNKRL